MAESILKFSTANFESDVLQSGQPVLVDFTAEWCPPCKLLAPTIGEIADEYSGRVLVGKLDCDQEPAVASQFRVENLPTVIVFKDGKAVDRATGLVPKTYLVGMLDKIL